MFRGSLGYLEGNRFRDLLDTYLPVKRFEDLTTPCVIVAANLSKKRREVFTTGNIADAVQASGTIPWTFKMKKIDARLFSGWRID